MAAEKEDADPCYRDARHSGNRSSWRLSSFHDRSGQFSVRHTGNHRDRCISGDQQFGLGLYYGMFTNGTVFDSNVNETPFNFTIGSRQAIPGFENAVIGMKAARQRP